MGARVPPPRKTNESEEGYHARLMNWANVTRVREKIYWFGLGVVSSLVIQVVAVIFGK